MGDSILVDGKDYTPFRQDSNLPVETWIKGYIDTQDAAWEDYLAKSAHTNTEAREVNEVEEPRIPSDWAAIFGTDSHPSSTQGAPKSESPRRIDPDAIMEAYKRRNRISKLVRILIANILAVPSITTSA